MVQRGPELGAFGERVRSVAGLVFRGLRQGGPRAHRTKQEDNPQLSGGASLATVGKALGHTQAATTARYAHLASSVQRESLRAAGERMAALKGTARKATVVQRPATPPLRPVQHLRPRPREPVNWQTSGQAIHPGPNTKGLIIANATPRSMWGTSPAYGIEVTVDDRLDLGGALGGMTAATPHGFKVGQDCVSIVGQIARKH